MAIFPRVVDNRGHDMSRLESLITDGLEVLMLNPNLLFIPTRASKYIQEQELSTLIIHLPRDWQELLCIYADRQKREEFEHVMVALRDVGNETDCEIFVVAHCSHNHEGTSKEFMRWLFSIVEVIAESGVTLLLENSIVNLNNSQLTDTSYLLVKEIDDVKLRLCFDLNHHCINEVLMGRECQLPEDIGIYTAAVHFSSSAVNIGNHFGVTRHGKSHKDFVSCEADYNKVHRLLGDGVSDMMIVAEASEDLLEPNPAYTAMTQEVVWIHYLVEQLDD